MEAIMVSSSSSKNGFSWRALLVAATTVVATSAVKECGIYLAPSTIPGAGLGMFAGNKGYKVGDTVTFGDVVVPVFELDWHNQREMHFEFLWGEYAWSFENFRGMEDEVRNGHRIHATSGGIGAAINCMLPLVNVDDTHDVITIGTSGVSSQSPGAGSFTPYHSRTFEATTTIEAGGELYAPYGEEYFASRPDLYGYIPLSGNYEQADNLLHEFNKLVRGLTEKGLIKDNTLVDDLWGLIEGKRRIWRKSRTLNALPEHYSVVEQVLQSGGTAKQYYNNSIRDLEWLEANGVCMDNIRDDVSTIPHAGRGAFANRPIAKGDIVAPAPLIHLPNRTILTMYNKIMDEDDVLQHNTTAPTHQQLLLNYCFGHSESTLLLCPYGLLTSLINHSNEKPNAEIEWSTTMRHEEWRDMPIDKWGEIMHTGLSFDYVALRDIKEGEEILLDYGDAWDRAWKEHVRHFDPPRKNYIPAFELNTQDNLRIRTADEQSYEENGVRLYCRNTYIVNAGVEMDDEATSWDMGGEPVYPCRVLQRINDDSYVAELFYRRHYKDAKISTEITDLVLLDVPRDAFYFRDAYYERDHHQLWSFRHEMVIPDSLFPSVWKNLKEDWSISQRPGKVAL